MTAASTVRVDPTNLGQLRAWDGDEGAYWAAHADRFDRAVEAHHRRLLEAAAITRTDRVLDIGCGTGQTTRDAARAAPDGDALGVDLSGRMLEFARRRTVAEGLTNARFEQADAQVHAFPSEYFDVAISRTGAMFFGDLVAAFTNIGRALKPGGTLALMVWQPLAANEWIREVSGALSAGRDMPAPPPDAPGPFALSEPQRVRHVLGAAGFADVSLEGVMAGMWFGSDSNDAREFILGLMGWMLDGLDDARRASAVEALGSMLAAHETSDGVVLGSAAWIVGAARG